MTRISRYLIFCLLIHLTFPLFSTEVRKILVNGKIVPGNRMAFSEAVVIEGDRIIFVGPSEQALKFKNGKKDRVFDLRGKMVVPGFHDGDMNFLLGAALLEHKFNFYGLDLETIVHRLKNERKKTGNGELFGFNFEHLLTSDGKWPNRYDLDKVSRNSPVIVFSSDGDTAWVNSHTLKLLNFDKNSGKVQGGRIHRFADRNPSGILMGRAVEMLGKLGFKTALQKIRPNENKILKAVKFANRFGVTSVTTLGDRELFQMLTKLEKEKKLNLRFNIVLPARNIAGYLIRKVNFSSESKKIRYVAVTKKVDGDICSSGSAMFSEYGERGNFGFLATNVNDISDLVSLYRNNGITADFAAGGERAVHVVLDGIGISTRRYKGDEQRYRLSNFCFVIDEDIDRLKKFRIIPVLRPAQFMDCAACVEETVGHRKSGAAMRIATLLNRGVRIAFGSGWPGGAMDPLRSIGFAVERKISHKGKNMGWFTEEKISFTAALEAYTYSPTYAVGMEKLTGSIEKGKLADLVILEGDGFSGDTGDVPALSRLTVIETILNGKTVFKKKRD